jgi:hypothetical protein
VATQLQLDKVELALTTLLSLTFGDDPTVRVDGMTVRDVDGDGNVLTIPPAVLLYFEGETLLPKSDNQSVTYTGEQSWSVFCGAADFSSRTAERKGAYQLAVKVRDALAGARLTLDDGTKLPPIIVVGTAPEQADANSVWYSVRIMVRAITQFSGVNG